MRQHLSQAEVTKRLARLRNYERLEPKRRQQMKDLKAEVKMLREENAMLRRRIQTLELQVEQLTMMIFGRRSSSSEKQDPSSGKKEGKPEPEKRTPSSYRRPAPKKTDITAHTSFPVDTCPDCGEVLTGKETIIRYVVDIPLPKKTVEEQSIGRGRCPCCGKTISGKEIPPQVSVLGENVRLYVLFAITVLGQTFEKVKTHLQTMHDFPISDGEIANILEQGHRRLLPEKKHIEAVLQAAAITHYDETGYPVQAGEIGNFAWIRTNATGPETLFLLGRTRGKGNAEEIRGPPSDQVAVSDDFASYDHLFLRHQLCWAHPLRKFRDLARSEALSPTQRGQCQLFYERFKELYAAVTLAVTSPLTGKERQEATAALLSRIDALMTPDANDLSKLATLKQTFLLHKKKYLVCVEIPGVPMTNNQAERRLRHLVIKRLLSFGSRTQKGAEAMETLFSVLFTLWWKKPADYFGELRLLWNPVAV